MSGYNGWSNYETWVTSLWYGNEYSDYLEIQGIVEEIKEQYAPEGDESPEGLADDKRSMRYELAERLRTHVTDEIDEALDNGNMGASLISDLVRSAMSEVDWSEWAENLLEE